MKSSQLTLSPLQLNYWQINPIFTPMVQRFLSILLIMSVNVVNAAVPIRWSDAILSQIIDQAQTISAPGDKVDFLSAQFLNSRYQPNTLIGSPNLLERLVVNLNAVDCLTYLEYVEAMRRSDSITAFLTQLKAVRYQNGVVDYYHRKHFFSDWLIDNLNSIQDVTQIVGGKTSLKANKILNKHQAQLLVPGIAPYLKSVYYIPAYKIDAEIVSRMKNGDYIGIFTEREGLDVNHVGILIKKAAGVYFRHADALSRRVVDVDFVKFFKYQRGIVVFRPLK